MYHKFQLKNDEFRQHYHEQSNVGTTFHMLKAKFGDNLHTKHEQAHYVETLLKILCHNVIVVIHEILETDIDPGFRAT